MLRGVYCTAVPVIAPKFVLASDALGIPYCTWLNALNMSARNVTLWPSHGIEKILEMPKSIFLTPSLKNVLRPTSAALESAIVNARNAERGKEMVDVWGRLTLRPSIVGSRSTGLLSAKLSKFKSSAVVVTVNGVPLENFATAENCQPPNAWPRMPLSPV